MSSAPNPGHQPGPNPGTFTGQPQGSMMHALGMQQKNQKTLFIIVGAAIGLFLLLGLLLIMLVAKSGGSSKATDPFGSGKMAQIMKPPRELPPIGSSNPARTPDDAAQAFLRDLQKKDPETAFQRGAQLFHNQITGNDFRELCQNNNGLYEFTVWKLNKVSSGGGRTTYHGKVGGGPFGSTGFILDVTSEPDGYRIWQFHPENVDIKFGLAPALKSMDAARGFMFELQKYKVEEAFERCGPALRGQYNLEGFTQVIQKQPPLLGFTGYRIEGGGQGGKTETWKITVNHPNIPGGAKFTIETTEQDGGWLVNKFTPG